MKTGFVGISVVILFYETSGSEIAEIAADMRRDHCRATRKNVSGGMILKNRRV